MIERHILAELVARGLNDREIAAMFSITRHTVMRWRQRYGIATTHTPKSADHGGPHLYRSGCRCEPCKDGHNERQRAYRARRKAETWQNAKRAHKPWTKKEEQALLEALDVRWFCFVYGRSYDAAQNKRTRLLKGDAAA